ncbi:uncharacterized protein LOC111716121 [Eurytemora carolleeae]|uniref:uncharacterized protein LOC111716121 n=1 Tax=Eurytemora carolleeae TaxID=1294199 RepID=UPI000C787008|nr:uncharacterized protein LOC111716121 [Eurytemora carolleeae]|eukprot:XP_023347311.1 uncharacterized protein LOC111716121 [Eurytemora affinis]
MKVESNVFEHEKKKKKKKDSFYEAVIICARYGDQGNERQKLALAWEQEIRSCIEDDKRKLTGLQFIFPGVTLFYIEGLEDDLNECIRLLNTLANKQMYGLNKIKIVHFLHNLRAVSLFFYFKMFIHS